MRYSYGHRELIKRIHDGAVGEIRALQANDFRGPIWVKPRQPDWTDMQYHMHNWYYFTWLSGDFNVEQHVHMLDTCSWIMKDEYPVSAMGLGGRQVRTGAEYGNIYDHHSVIYEYANGVKVFSECRQIPGCWNSVSEHVHGTKGSCNVGGYTITGENAWKYRGGGKDPYQQEHDDLFDAIRNDKPYNEAERGALSSMTAILGRMCTNSVRESRSWN